MAPLVQALHDACFHCHPLTLHQSRPRDHIDTLTPEWIARRWVEQVATAHDQLTRDYPNLPIFNLSYSAGALATLQFLQHRTSAIIHRMALFAPALVLTRPAKLLHFVTLLGLARSPNLSLPSLAPPNVKARPATPLCEYAAMLQLMRDVTATTAATERIGNIPTQVFLNRRDEVVSYSGIAQWLRRQNLRRWELTHVPVTSGQLRHLAVLPGALKGSDFSNIVDNLVAFFREKTDGTLTAQTPKSRGAPRELQP